MKEKWMPIKGFYKYYEISSLGRVKSLKRKVKMSNQYSSWEQILPEKIMKTNKDSCGYLQVVLTKSNRKRVARVHRLVAEAFLIPPSKKLISNCKQDGLNYVPVNHKDGDRLNNHLDNLEWCNTAHNNNHCIKKGLKSFDSVRGEKHYFSKLKKEEVIAIVKEYAKGNCRQTYLANKYNVKQITISNILTGKSWAWLTGIRYGRKNYNLKSKIVEHRKR